MALINTKAERYGQVVNMNKKTVSDRDIQALVDGELSTEHAARVHEHLLRNPRARHRYDALLKQKKLLQEWWRSRRQ